MIRSMTGYGSAETEFDGVTYAVELRSVNHRFSDVAVRLPRDLGPLEDQARALVAARIGRGRVDVTVARDVRARRARSVRADVETARGYLAAFRTLGEALALPGEVTVPTLATLPDVVKIEEEKTDLDALWPALRAALETSLAGLLQMRAEEGARLHQDLVTRLDHLEAYAGEVRGRAGLVVEDYTGRLRARMRELLGGVVVDDARLALEAAAFAERSDITEELTRFASHLVQFRDAVRESDGPVGRTLEFILQEMGREVNTIGAKANDAAIARTVIAMKGVLESLREQVQNVE